MSHPAKDARDAVQRKFPGARVVERKRNSIKHQHPTDPNKFILDTGIGPMHFGVSEDQEIDTAWQPGTAPWDFEMTQAGYNAHALADFSSGQIVRYTHPRSGENIRFQPQQLQYTNDLDQIQAIANPQSVDAVVVDEDVLLWTGAYGTGFDLRWQAQTARLDKRLVVDSMARFPAPAQFIIDGGNPVLRFQFIFAVSNGVDIYVNDVLWTRAQNSRVDTQGYVEFRLSSTGETLWHFNLPRTFKPNVDLDVEDPELLGTFRLRRQANNLFVEHRVPLTELRAATYPVEIDVTIDEEVAASVDDGYVNADFGNYNYSSSFMYAGEAAGGIYDMWYRFDSISGLSGATIDVAYVSLYENSVGAGWATNVYADDQASPTAPTSIANYYARTPTTAFVAWDGALTDDVYNDSPSLITIFQELADSYNPDAILILHKDDGSSLRGVLYTYDHGEPPKLHIEYNAAVLEQEGFRWRDDDDDETSASWLENQDIDTEVASETNIRLRVLTDATGDPDSAAATLQYKRDDEDASEWRDV